MRDLSSSLWVTEGNAVPIRLKFVTKTLKIISESMKETIICNKE